MNKSAIIKKFQLYWSEVIQEKELTYKEIDVLFLFLDWVEKIKEKDENSFIFMK